MGTKSKRNSFKTMLSKIVPATIYKVNWSWDSLMKEIQRSGVRTDEVLAALREEREEQRAANESLRKEIRSLRDRNESLHKEIQSLRDQNESLAKVLTKSLAACATKEQASWTDRSTQELIWADVFHDAIQGSAWLTDRRFAPGRWALGYPALYVLFRVLDNVKPERILELGLGQSTRMIAQYAASNSANAAVSHTVCEENPEWIEFFRAENEIPETTQIVQMDYVMGDYKGTQVRQYDGFREQFAGQKFDLIMIDAPLGGDMKTYARVDVLGILPDCLKERFVILLDDANRSGEQAIVKEIETVLTESGISYKKGIYTGQKQIAVICSESLGFLTSM